MADVKANAKVLPKAILFVFNEAREFIMIMDNNQVY